MREEFGDSIMIDIVVKTKENKIGEWLRSVKGDRIDSLLNIEYYKDKLIKYILV